MKILIVDDDTNFIALIKLILESEGFDVVLANNGEDGYFAYLLFEPDLVITDIQMPIKTGIELIRLIRDHNPRVKTVYMSADMTPFRSLLNEEQEKYGVSVLEKPFSRTELMTLISQACSSEKPKLCSSKTFKKGDKDPGLKSEFSQPSGTKRNGDSDMYTNPSSPSREEGGRFLRTNMEFCPPSRDRTFKNLRRIPTRAIRFLNTRFKFTEEKMNKREKQEKMKKTNMFLLLAAVTMVGLFVIVQRANTQAATPTWDMYCSSCHGSASSFGPRTVAEITSALSSINAMKNISLTAAQIQTISNELSGSTADTTPPTVTVFSIPATSTSLTVSITTFTATDNVAVTGYVVTESATKPAATATGWTTTAPTSYVFTTAGAKTLYAWAKDAAGNVSTSRSASVTITLPPTADTTPPVVTAFSIPAISTSLTVSITTFTATDNVAVTGYVVTESATKPAATATGWTATVPTSYAFATAGAKTLYAWAKDAAGNVSASRSASVTITLSPTSDTTPPTVTTFTIPASSSSLTVPITSFGATDNVAVTGFIVTESGTKPAATATGWTATAPASYAFATAGAKTLYAWAKDAAGNVSNSRSATTSITLSQPPQPGEGLTFSNPASITNAYLPLSGLVQDTFEGTLGGKVLRVERTLTGKTKGFIFGNQTIETLIVEDRSFVDNTLQEVALTYFAQADDGAVYSFGETIDIYDSKGRAVIAHEGSWLYGVDSDQPAITIPLLTTGRLKFRARTLPTIPNAKVARVRRMIVPAGRFLGCLKISETLPDGTVEHRYYAPNVGLIKEVFSGGEMSLISHNEPNEPAASNLEDDGDDPALQ